MKGFNVFKVIVYLIFAILVVSFVFWIAQKKKPLNIFILDKSVLDYKYSEHKSFNWVLNYNRITKPNGTPYDYSKDYYGFHPTRLKSPKEYKIKSIRLYEVLSIPDDLNMLYITDSYGVTYEDWYHRPPDKIHSNLIYGGLNQNDYLLLSEMRRKQKLIITEFNILASPTSDLIRSKTESLFDFYWTGWTGCYFSSLEKTNRNLPRWIIQHYESNNAKWNFSGEGIILIHENGDIVVLESQKHLNQPVPEIISSTYGIAQYSLPEKQAYSYWFDIINPGSSNTTVASYNLDVTPAGAALMNEKGIPVQFPAVIEHLKYYKFYYFAGDFCDRNLLYGTSYFKGFPTFAKKLSFNASGSKSAFFWRFYVPLVENIIKKQWPN